MHPPHLPQPNDFGRKITLNFGAKIQSQNRRRPFFFFGDHLILGEKNLCGRKFSLKIGEDLFFFFGRPPDFGRKKPLNFRLLPKNHSQSR